tara:strand:+ start:1269 stop:1847 length:579 start_codon:yes stop_codon:yes gene_type:complete
LIIIIIGFSLIGCLKKENEKYLPKGYYRINFEENKYQTTHFNFKNSDFSFETSQYFNISSANRIINEEDYLEITLKNSKHNFGFILNYRIIQNNLKELTQQAYNPQLIKLSDGVMLTQDVDEKLLIYELKGPVANPFIFQITDKKNHFLYGMMYVCMDKNKNCNINTDSLRPVIDFFEKEIYNIYKTIKWSN